MLKIDRSFVHDMLDDPEDLTILEGVLVLASAFRRQAIAEGRMDEFRETLSHSLAMVFLITVPSSVGLVVLGKSIIGGIYQGGAFKLFDTEQTAVALSCYAIGLTGYAGIKIINPAFYALGDSRTPMLVSLGSILVNFAAANILIRGVGMGHAGLALSTSSVALFGFLVQFAVLRARISGVHGRFLMSQIARIAVASMVMGGVAAATSFGMERMIAVLTEAPPQSEMEDLSFLAQGGVPQAKRGAGDQGGFSQMLTDIGLAPSMRSAMKLNDQGGSKGAVMIFPVETTPLTALYGPARKGGAQGEQP